MNMVVGAALAGQAIPQTVLANESPQRDPIFDLIEKHKRANGEYYEALKVVPGTLNPDPEKEELYGGRESDIRWELASTTPATLPGLMALLSYVVGVTEGPCSPSGKPDIAFEATGELYNIVAGVMECLEKHFRVT